MKKTDLVYKDQDYEIYKKYAGDIGTIMQEADILQIGISGIKNIRHHFKFEEDYFGLINSFIEQLEVLKNEKS